MLKCTSPPEDNQVFNLRFNHSGVHSHIRSRVNDLIRHREANKTDVEYFNYLKKKRINQTDLSTDYRELLFLATEYVLSNTRVDFETRLVYNTAVMVVCASYDENTCFTGQAFKIGSLEPSDVGNYLRKVAIMLIFARAQCVYDAGPLENPTHVREFEFDYTDSVELTMCTDYIDAYIGSGSYERDRVAYSYNNRKFSRLLQTSKYYYRPHFINHLVEPFTVGFKDQLGYPPLTINYV
jgi:hypothetical protein